jgi:hypothetical protein
MGINSALRALLRGSAGCVFLWLLATAWATEPLRLPKAPSVTVAPAGPIAVAPGKQAKLELDFRVEAGFHINSSQPKNSLMLPTTLRLSPPTNIMIGKVSYPPGEDLSFDFLPGEKFNVYTGDFAITALITPVQSVSVGTYRVHGMLKYQACDNRQCYPPKEVPVAFDVKVQKAKQRTSTKSNPAQSPHIHQ